MSRHATDFQVRDQVQVQVEDKVQERLSSRPLPADNVLSSGSVLFPGAFDRHGCPLVVFPADTQAKLSSELSKAEVVDFVRYFHAVHNRRQEKQSLVSVVADLRDASPPAARFIAETLLLLQLHQKTVHSVYLVQPRKKDVNKLLLKLLSPSKPYSLSFKKVLLKEIPELSNHVDRSQLPASLGGYLMYRHQSWVAFVKDVDVFVQDFLSVVQRLPSCISALQALSRLPLPSSLNQLQNFCCTNQAKFVQLRRELGLDELLRHCEGLLEKLRHPESDACYQDMAGTALFTHTAFDMLHNHSRITAAVDKVDQLWQQAFAAARLQLQLLQLRDRALQVTDKMESLFLEKLQPYKIHVSKDTAEAAMLASEFETSVYTPAMALVLSAEELIHSAAEVLPPDAPHTESWVVDLERLKDKLQSAVRHVLQTLRTVSTHHHYYDKANRWYSSVLHENFLQELLSGVHGDDGAARRPRSGRGTVPAWRRKLSSFLKKNPSPDMEELLHLTQLSAVVPDDEMQQAGREMAHRCSALRKLLISSGPVDVGSLQSALQWQYHLLRSEFRPEAPPAIAVRRTSPPQSVCGRPPAPEGTAASLGSLDSGFGGHRGADDSLDSARRQKPSDGEGRWAEPDPGPVASGSCFHIVPKVTADSLNLEITVKRRAAMPSNPWLSLPVDDLESSYTVTITPKASPRKAGGQEAGWIPPPPPHGEPDDPDLDSVRHLLSSTVSDGGEETLCTAEGAPTLLWDSYDLHHQDADAVDSSATPSPGDWELAEQEGLRRVEQILGRTDQILEEEENVAAQEAVLDALLLSDSEVEAWPPWSRHDDAQPRMASRELAAAGVLGLDDSFHPAEWDGLEAGGSSPRLLFRNPPPPGGPDLLRELQDVQLKDVRLLDRLIEEENLKLRELQRSRDILQEPRGNESSADRDAFRERLEEERREVEQLEHSWDREVEDSRDREVEQLEDSRDREVEQLEDSWDRDVGLRKEDELLETERLDSGTPEGRRLSEDNVLKRLCEDGTDSDSLGHRTSSFSPPDMDGHSEDPVPLQRRLSRSNVPRTSSQTELLGSVSGPDVTAEVPSQQFDEPSSALDPREVSPVRPQPCDASEEPSSTPDEDALDPGVGPVLLPPVPKPRKVLLPRNDDEPLESSGSTEGSDPPAGREIVEAQSENVEPDGPSLDLHPITNTQHNNNNNRSVPVHDLVSEVPTVEPSSSETSGDVWDCPESQTVPEPPPDGPQETVLDWNHGIQRSESVRVSHSGSTGVLFQPDGTWRQVTDYETPIVLDTGSGLMKAGFADQDLPQVVFPTIIGAPKYEEVMNGSAEREFYIGQEAQAMRGVLALRHPIKNGVVRCWDDMEKIWQHAFQQLRADPEDHPVLLTEAAMNPLENRQRALEIMFERFAVPFGFVAMQAVLALYADGRTTGVVLDSGDGVSHSVPVFDGYCLPHAVQRLNLGGADVTAHLQKLLQEQGVSMRTTAEAEIVREMKEKCCYVAADYEAELKRGAASRGEACFTMPDGRTVTLSTERFRAPEILFRPELIGRDHDGMHESVLKSVLGSDIDLRRSFLGNVVLSGGNTLLSGLPERLQASLSALVPADLQDQVRVSSPRDRDSSVWSGGAVMARLPGFSSAWISREEYEESGPQIVFRKCF